LHSDEARRSDVIDEKREAALGYKKPDISLVGDNHLKKYLETNGEVGYIWNGVPCLVLTTKGRRSGKMHQIPIIYCQVGDKYVLIASHGGAPENPKWYLNLVAEPRAQIQMRGDKFDVVARTAESPEREKLWEAAAAAWPNYNIYTTRTSRKIPLVVLERAK
jgi:deazaflavin-dependent oxidoreductase (nitroreductase family)